ncbi:MAG: response regulator [Thiolinea sp.]
MEDGDGYKACRNLKRDEVTANIPVIMVSSKSNPVDKKWAEKLGAAGYVVKPYADEQILQQLKALS